MLYSLIPASNEDPRQLLKSQPALFLTYWEPKKQPGADPNWLETKSGADSFSDHTCYKFISNVYYPKRLLLLWSRVTLVLFRLLNFPPCS